MQPNYESLYPAGHKITANHTLFRKAIRDLGVMLGATMGPFGRLVMPVSQIANDITKDGAKVIMSYMPQFPIERTAVARMQDAALGTMRVAGDGTSTTGVFMANLYERAMSQLEGFNGPSGGQVVMPRLVAERITEYVNRMIEILEEMTTTEVDLGLITKVATVAAANNAEIGEKIGKLIMDIGVRGTIKIEYVLGTEIQTEIQPGYVLESGLYDQSMLPQAEPDLTLYDPYIVLVNEALTENEDVGKLAEQWEKTVYAQKKPNALVLVVSDLGGNAMSLLLNRTNHETGKQMPIYCIRPPKDVPAETFFSDLAEITGGTVLSKTRGKRIDGFSFTQHAGKARLIKAGMTRTMITPASDKVFTSLSQRLEKEVAGSEDKDYIETLKARIARLEGKVGVIKIPGMTQSGLMYGQAVIDDSWRAAKAALEFGVLPGCGRSLLAAFDRLSMEVADMNGIEDNIAYNAVRMASESIFAQVLNNAGIDDGLIQQFIDYLNRMGRHGNTKTTVLVDFNLINHYRAWVKEGQNADTGEAMYDAVFQDAFQAGVLDSSKAITSALKHALAEVPSWIQTGFFTTE